MMFISLISSSLYFSVLPPNTQAVTEMREKYLRDYTIIYVWSVVGAFRELILGDIPAQQFVGKRMTDGGMLH